MHAIKQMRRQAAQQQKGRCCAAKQQHTASMIWQPITADSLAFIDTEKTLANCTALDAQQSSWQCGCQNASRLHNSQNWPRLCFVVCPTTPLRHKV
jgi:hypothetical protein